MKQIYKVPTLKMFVIETEDMMITASGGNGLEGVGNGGTTEGGGITEADTRKQSIWELW